MKIVNDRAVVLKTRRPHLITEKVKNYKILAEDKGVYKIVIPWGLEEAQVLANLKVKQISSPMFRDYEFNGRYKPFAHQKDTSSFLTLNKKAFCSFINYIN